ncbi:hypothetical protein TGAM01_v202619 [Trichoderma gamsii]|uniref:Uncharacterized protein n=1 Tax=Trichoderma gamsii TaxID=398673 RepID=A0A2P4ZWU0_9HYPO|nr:hypothetical protein TGAM01_v202619 [Trichoderma gamsii]PON28772.1 hypothetical protein TGAM01_v202619 [Trichoderma gamsii]
MSDSQSQERPAKRLKLAPHPQPAAPQPGPQLRFIKPVPFPSVVAPPRSMVNVPLSWVNVVSTTRPKRARVREPEPEPEVGPETEPERELRHGRGRGGGRGGRGGRRKRARGYASTSESGTPQTEEAEPVGDAELETASSPAPSESVSSQMSTQTSTKMSPEYSPEASSEASSELSFDMVSEALSEATYEPMELEATIPMATVVMSQDINASSPLTESTLSPSYYEDSLSHADFPELQSHLLGDLAEALAEEFASPAAEQASPSSTEGEQHSSRKPRHGFVSPFKDCLDTFGKLSSLRFNRPTDGTVNSYIKFNWPKHDELYSRPSSKSAATQYGEDDDQNKHVRQLSQSSSTLIATKLLYNQASPESTSEQFYSEQLGRYSRSPSLPSSSASYSVNLSPSNPSSYARSWDQRNLQILRQMTEYTVPKLPSHFGFVSQMDDMDRRFFYFYFACMEGSEGVRSAIQSLAGVYVYDYQPLEKVAKRINLRYRQAEARLSQLLESTDLSVDEASELITILCIMSMHDWSNTPLSNPFEVAQVQSQAIEWVRAAPEGYMVGNTTEMTEVTAEAWRITAVIYLQCRALRLPRDHPDVIANLSYLAKCISIMPTSGYQFTAQAPLFPVFLLGMLATVAEHAGVAQKWFDSVTSAPVRSSVPPLYETLKRIWTWIDDEPSIVVDLESLDDDIANRYPWWEHLIQRVQEKEQEILCLT